MVSQVTRISEIIVNFGLSAENLVFPLFFLLISYLSFIIPIALLLSFTMTIVELCANQEMTSLLSFGVSLKRFSYPILFLSSFFFLSTLCCTNYLESWGRAKLIEFMYKKTKSEFDAVLSYKMQEGVFVKDIFSMTLFAEKISEDRSIFQNVIVAPYKEGKNSPFYIITASQLEISGKMQDKNLYLKFKDGSTFIDSPAEDTKKYLNFEELNLSMSNIIEQQFQKDHNIYWDYRSFDIVKLSNFIKNYKISSDQDKITLREAKYLFFHRLFSPLIIFIFSIFSIVFGIYNPRVGSNYTLLKALILIVVTYVFNGAGRWAAENGFLMPSVGAFLPLVLLLLCSVYFMMKRNRVPLWDSIFDLRKTLSM